MIRLKVEWDEEPDQFVAADGLVAILLELPVPVVQRADLPGLQPPAHQQSLSKIKHSESGRAESYSGIYIPR